MPGPVKRARLLPTDAAAAVDALSARVQAGVMQQGEALPITFRRPVTLVGGGPVLRTMLDEAREIAPDLVAADRGADRLAAWGMAPAAVIGDMDSITDPDRWRAAPVRFVHLAEQDTTDFEKCLYATEAPFYLAVGFTGGRVDHQLAVLHVMLARPEKTVVLVGEEDVIALVPPGRPLAVVVDRGARVSLFPLRPVTGTRSRGLAWSVEGLRLEPGTRVGTSNVATGEQVEVAFDGAGALILLGRQYLGALLAAVAPESAAASAALDRGPDLA